MAAPNFVVVNSDAPAEYAATITPNDGTDLTQMPRGVYVGTGGDIAVQMLDGTSVTFSAVPGGVILPVRPRRVLATGTTAANLVALY